MKVSNNRDWLERSAVRDYRVKLQPVSDGCLIHYAAAPSALKLYKCNNNLMNEDGQEETRNEAR